MKGPIRLLCNRADRDTMPGVFIIYRNRFPRGAFPMPIRFTCSCGQQLQTAEEHAGRTVRCPTCGKDNTVPDLLQAVLPVEAVLPSPNPPEAVETDERHIKPAPTVRPLSRP